MSSDSFRADLAARVDAIEAAYELMLAYAAQGIPSDQQSANGAQLREFLRRFEEALTGLADTYRALVDTMAAEPGLRLDPAAADAATTEFVARYAGWPADAQRRADDVLDALAQSTSRPFAALDRGARTAHLRSCGRPTDDDPVGPERRRLDLAQGAMSLAAVTLGPSGGELDRPLDSV